MNELTREEVRRACEAVGWWWESDGITSARDSSGLDRFYATESEDRSRSNAIALMEATGTDYTVWRRKLVYQNSKEGPDFSVEIQWGDGEVVAFGPDLPTAAVRAVNAWAEERAAEVAP